VADNAELFFESMPGGRERIKSGKGLQLA